MLRGSWQKLSKANQYTWMPTSQNNQGLVGCHKICQDGSFQCTPARIIHIHPPRLAPEWQQAGERHQNQCIKPDSCHYEQNIKREWGCWKMVSLLLRPCRHCSPLIGKWSLLGDTELCLLVIAVHGLWQTGMKYKFLNRNIHFSIEVTITLWFVCFRAIIR